MAEERDEKDLTGDLAVDDESAGEVTGGRTTSEGASESLAEFANPAGLTSRRMKPAWTHRWMKRR